MSNLDAAAALRQMRIIAVGMILGPIFLLGVGLLLRVMGTHMGDVPVLTYVAAAFAVTAPLVAGFLKNQITAPYGAHKVPPEKARAAVIVPYALLEGAAMICGVAFLLTPTYWPLLAALIPLGTMVLWFPRE